MSSNRKKIYKYLEDEGLAMFTKKEDQEPNSKIPPKVRGKHFSNMDYLAEADLVCLTPTLTKAFPSPIYDKLKDYSYKDQCFINITRLGQGSFGNVLKVVDVDDKRFYALKVSKEPYKSDADRATKSQEITYHQSFIGHPNVVTLYSAWEEDRHLHMKMELCKCSLLSFEVVPETMCWDVLVDILMALDYINTAGCGHFDVKLENILLGYDGKYKLTDFGLVYNFKKNKHQEAKEGDAKYLAPELLGLVTRSNFTAKADVFSLGISILELAGNLRLPSNGPVWLALRNDKFPFEQTKHISDGLMEVISSMMMSNYKCRPTAREVLDYPLVTEYINNKNRVHPLTLQPATEPTTTLLVCFVVWGKFSQLVQLVSKELLQMMDFITTSSSFLEMYTTEVMDTSFSPDAVSASSIPCNENELKMNSSLHNGRYSASKLNAKASEINGNLSSLHSSNGDWLNSSSNGLTTHDSTNSNNSSPKNSRTNGHPYLPLPSFLNEHRMLDSNPSPIHISHTVKEALKAEKKERVQRARRNLTDMFKEDCDDSDN